MKLLEVKGASVLVRACGATENARLEVSAPNCRGGKCGTKQL